MQGEWTTGHRIADISTNDENLVSIDFDDDVAVTGVVAALLMVEIDARLARPTDQIADGGPVFVETPSPEPTSLPFIWSLIAWLM